MFLFYLWVLCFDYDDICNIDNNEVIDKFGTSYVVCFVTYKTLPFYLPDFSFLKMKINEMSTIKNQLFNRYGGTFLML